MSLTKYVRNVEDPSDHGGYKFRSRCDHCSDGFDSQYVSSSATLQEAAGRRAASRQVDWAVERAAAGAAVKTFPFILVATLVAISGSTLAQSRPIATEASVRTGGALDAARGAAPPETSAVVAAKHLGPRALLRLRPPAASLLLAQLGGLHDQTQQVVLLAPNLDPYSVSELVRGLTGIGVRARRVRDAKLDPALEACGTFSCLAQVARSSQHRAALASVSTAGDGSKTLLLVLVDADGSNAQTRVRIGSPGIAQALVAAWKEASLAISLAGEAMIHAESRPAGANVWLDGVPVGTTPFARQVSPGTHRLMIKLDGFVPQERVIEVQSGKAQRFELLLKREPRFDDQQLTAVPAPRASAWNYVLGGTLVLAAVPALIASINALANDGQCLRVHATAADRCDRATFGERSAYLFAAGVVALGTGGVVFLAQPMQEGEERSP